MNVVDSSGWIEYFVDGPNASFFQPAIRDTQNLIVPAISIYEVYRHALAHRTREMALDFFKAMSMGNVVDLSAAIAADAATLAHDHKFVMADAIILATAEEFNAILWTQDVNFKEFPGVKYRAKSK